MSLVQDSGSASMTTFATPCNPGEPGGVAAAAVLRPSTQRDSVEALGLLLGVLGVLLGLVLTVGATLPIGP
jgi:hypothetical protein